MCSLSITRNIGNYESVKANVTLACDVPFDQPYQSVLKDMKKLVSEEVNAYVEEEAQRQIEERKRKMEKIKEQMKLK